MDLNKQNEIKLDILESLARSQRAIARMMESIADISEVSQSTAVHVAENMKIINKYQYILAQKIVGVEIGKTKRGSPAKPWLNSRLRATCSSYK